MPNVIGLYSPVPRSGKSTVADYLCHHHGYIRIPFASTLKEMAAVLMRDLGVIDTHEYLDSKKHVALFDIEDIDEDVRLQLHCSIRYICQTLGTEWGRTCIHPDLWILVWQAKVNRMLRSGIQIVVDDVRFPNEFEKVKSLGGEMWRITRPSLVVDPSVVNHASEGSLDRFVFDCEIYNKDSLQDLYRITETLIHSTRPLTSLVQS